MAKKFDFVNGINLGKLEVNEILDLFHEQDVIIPIVIKKIKVGSIIERGRRNYNQEIFTKKGQLSYRKDHENIHDYGRVNTPNQSRFYGTNTKNEDYSRIAIYAEISEEFRSGIPPNDEGVKITLGKWEVTKEFEVATLIGYAPYHVNLIPKIKADLIKLAPPKRVVETLASFKFFSGQFAKTDIKHHTDYKICNAFAYSVFDIEKLGGIVYPSVRADYEYDNIVLAPNVVDECLKFKQAGVCNFKYDSRGKPLLDFEMISTSDNVGVNEIVWKQVKQLN